MGEARTSVRSRMGAMPTSMWITITVGLLCTIGLFMVGSASSVISMSYYGSPWSIFAKEVLWVVVGAVVFFFAARTDYHRWGKIAPLAMAATMVLLLVVMIPGVGSASGGSTRWIGVGPFVLQPSELMKLVLAIFGANLIARRQERSTSLRFTIFPVVIVTLAAAGLVLAQPDLGTAFVLIVIMMTLAVSAGIPGRTVLKSLLLIGAAVAIAALAMPYRRDRLLSFINPGSKSSEGGYQVVQSLIGMGSGGVGGLGLGHSHEKWGLLPNAHTDFIFSVIGEELGILGAFVVVVLVGVLALKGWRAAEQAPDRFGMLLAAALVAWISSEAVINIGAVLGIVPVTGIPLPFVSYGGTSMVITLAAAGILVNIARQEKPVRASSRSRESATRSSGRPSPRRPATGGAARRPARTT